jgi:hypothetical protein
MDPWFAPIILAIMLIGACGLGHARQRGNHRRRSGQRRAFGQTPWDLKP